MPFTTPVLDGSRTRRNKKNQVELIVPNPSGGRGVYITPWDGVSSLCRPTLHDTVLYERIRPLKKVIPGAVRGIARKIAIEGLAGEEAQATALMAARTDASDRTTLNYQLLMIMVRQVTPSFTAAIGTMPTELSAQVRQGVAWMSRRLNRPTTWTAVALEELAHALSEVGLSLGADAAGWIPRVIAMVRQVGKDLGVWGRTQLDETLKPFAEMVSSVAGFTVALADTELGRIKSLIGNMADLLGAWASDPRSVLRLIERPEWLLDGWERICLLWNDAADQAAKRVALVEIVGLVPVLPSEVNSWGGDANKLDQVRRRRRMVYLNEDWRTGLTVFDLISRNERLRAFAC